MIVTLINAIENYKLHERGLCENIGVWGDGSLGYVTALVLKMIFPKSKIIVFGHNPKKSIHFIHADQVIDIEEWKEKIELDCAFECVGGRNSVYAIEQAIDLIRPQGCISLLGVSEEPISINIRKILEKGITLFGNSRSERSDFETAVKMIMESEKIRTQLRTIISENKKVSTLDEIYEIFESAQINDFKTIMKWNL